MKFKLGFLAVITGVSVSIWIYNVNGRSNKEGGKTPTVSIYIVKRGDIVDSVGAIGRIEAVKEVAIRAKESMLINRILVEKGNQVKKGEKVADIYLDEKEDDVLKARIKKEQLEIEVEGLKNRLSGSDRVYGEPTERKGVLREKEGKLKLADIDKRTAEREYQVTKELYDLKFKSLQTVKEAEEKLRAMTVKYENAKQEYNEAKTLNSKQEVTDINRSRLETKHLIALKKLSIAKTELNLAKRRLERLSVSSPMSGTVLDVPVEDGMFVKPGTIIAIIADLNNLQVVAEVDELEANSITKGKEAYLIFNSIQEQKFYGEVTKISPRAEVREKRTVVDITIKLRRKTRGLKVGNQVDVVIYRNERKQVVIIPHGIIRDVNKPYVWIYKKGIVSKRDLKTGISDIDMIEITANLSEGEKVVSSKHSNLRDGQQVSLR